MPDATKPKMSYAEAAKIAQRGKNEFRAFERLEEMLTAAAQAEAAIPRAEARLAALERDIERDVRAREQAEAELETARAEAGQALADLDAKHRADVAKRRDQLDELDVAIEDRNAKLAAREAEVAEAIAAAGAREAEARAKAEAAEAELAALAGRLASAAA